MSLKVFSNILRSSGCKAPETGTTLPSKSVIWDPTPTKSSSSIWNSFRLANNFSKVNLLTGGNKTYFKKSSHGTTISGMDSIVKSPLKFISKNVIDFLKNM